jgi:UDPglucose 6-dehydrogenase
MAYNIGVIGTGYVGLVTGTCFAATGNNVYCIDILEEKVNLLKQGKSPIYEPGLEVLLQRNLKEERLHFSTDLEEAVKNCQIIFLCLPTPPSEDGSADLHHVLDATEQICHIIKKYDLRERKILINKSTVPVGTADKTRAILDKFVPDYTIDVASNPEFLREGFAIEDSLKPERVVIGTESEYAEEVLKDLYQPFMRSGNPIYIMDIKSAEITKYAANAFLATKISFMNDLSAYCEVVGADIEKVRLGIGSDTRIGKRFLFAGVGYGGSCFPKDVRALIHSTEQAGTPLDIVTAAQAVNLKQTKRFIAKIKNRFDNQIKGKKFAIWGLAFKPDTDDTREAPAFIIIEDLLAGGAVVSSYDPEAMNNTRIKFGDKIEYCDNLYDCLIEADALIIATEWTVFRNPDFQKMQDMMKETVIFDGRNLYSNTEMEKLKFEYHCIGRKGINTK